MTAFSGARWGPPQRALYVATTLGGKAYISYLRRPEVRRVVGDGGWR